jgi:hypothetical protein
MTEREIEQLFQRPPPRWRRGIRHAPKVRGIHRPEPLTRKGQQRAAQKAARP